MDNPPCAWAGKILHVDLSEHRISEINTLDYAERFLGGRGIATRLYWEEVSPDIHAFNPENKLIFMCGALVSTGAQGANRMTLLGKSPMTNPEGFCYANLGGFFPAYLKRAGFDGMVITGRSKSPCYLWVHDGMAEILDASSLWGKGTYRVQNLLKEKHGRKARFVSIGIAGENRCRNAVVVTDHEGSATGGFGAVMGSKNLKAVVALGSNIPAVADKKKLAELNRHIVHVSKRGSLRMPIPKDQMQFTRTASCYQCAIECGRGLYKTSRGREEVRKCQAMAFYLKFAAARSDEPIDTSLDATRLCNNLGICTMEVQNILIWLEACHREGVLDTGQTGLDFSLIGSPDFIAKLVSMIARREGFGDILAQGIIRAGKELGPEAEALFGESTKAVGLNSSYGPREYPVTALLYGLEPRQPIAQLHDVSHLIARWLLHLIRPKLSPTTAEVFRKSAAKFWKHAKAWDMTTLEGKAEAAVHIQNRTYAKDSLGLCDFGWPIMDSFNTEDHTGDPTLENRLFSVVTGMDVDEQGLDRFGERIFNLQRAILLREGWRPSEDDSPAEFNFTTPLTFDPLNPRLIVPGATEEPACMRGNVLDRKGFEQMRREFYKLRSWDPATGLLKKEALGKLGLTDVADTLARGPAT